MNPLLSIISLLAGLRAELHTKFNAAIERFKPLEQQEAGAAARGIFSEIDWASERLKRSGEELQATLDKAGNYLAGFEKKTSETPEMAAARFLEEYEKKVGADAIAAAVAAKTLVSMEDHTSAITAAKESAATEAKTAAETEFNAKLQTIETLATRRKEAVTKLGEIAATTITDEVLAGDKHEDAITAKEVRIAKLKEHDITAEGRKDLFSNLVAKSTDEEFDASLKLILDAAGGKLAPIKAATTTPPAPAPAPGSQAGLSAGGAPTEKKKMVC